MKRREQFRLRASLCLPPDALDLCSGGSGLPAWVLLDSLAYIVPGVRNHTTAQTKTRDGRTIEVTFLIAHPPRRSYWCICCPDSDDDNPFDYMPTIVSSAEDLALIKVGLTASDYFQWFVYHAATSGPPSLVLLLDIHLYSQPLMKPYGLVSSPDNNGFFLAALSYNYELDAQYDLHLFSSVHSTWNRQPQPVDYGRTKKPDRLYPTKVIGLGDGVLDWVDLWEGILTCDVRAVAKGIMPAAARFVPMPRPLPRNQELYRQHQQSDALPLRNATFGHDHIRCVELEELVRLKPKPAPVVHDPSDLLLLYDSESPMVPEDDEYEAVGWRLVTWFRALTWDHWQRGSMLRSDDLGPVSFPQLGNLPWKDLETGSPVLCAAGDAVYLMSMLKKRHHHDKTAWIVALDTKTNSLPHQPMPFSADRTSPDNPTHIPCAITRYLDRAKSG